MGSPTLIGIFTIQYSYLRYLKHHRRAGRKIIKGRRPECELLDSLSRHVKKATYKDQHNDNTSQHVNVDGVYFTRLLP